MRTEIKKAILKALLRANGTPMPHGAIVGAGLTAYPVPPKSEVESVIKEMEAQDDFISGADNSFGERDWTLTRKGKHEAQQL